MGYKSPYPPSGESSRGEAWIIARTRDIRDSGRPFCIGKFQNLVVRIDFCISLQNCYLLTLKVLLQKIKYQTD